MDKWLWAARFFKTRAIAARACELGRIESNGQPAKPAREVRMADKLRITNPASVAQTLYRESEESKEARMKAAAERKAAMQFEPMPTGRPSKRDRRKIIQFRGRG